MELSWSTMVLEIINFLVLIWTLNHFLYMPIQNPLLLVIKLWDWV